MSNQQKKREPWRILAGIAAIAFILFMWIRKNIAAIYATVPQEQTLPLIVTTVLVSLLKVGLLTGGLLLLKWLLGKYRKK
jgi:hypothetical protein